MVIDLERAKQNFKDHVATFSDYGNIKVLDFQRPGSNEYRIRFIFEEDCYRCHISGDLGELIAANYRNMTYEGFIRDYMNDPGYFSDKILTHSRELYVYDDQKATDNLKEIFQENEYDFTDEYHVDTVEESWDEKINEILRDFDEIRGIGTRGYDILSEIDSDCWEYISGIGKEKTGIIELYILAFRLAQEDLKKQEETANG